MINVPFIAILQDLPSDDAISVVQALLTAGITKISVPLNTPDALETISNLAAELGDQAEIGAGAVLSVTVIGVECSS